MRVVDLFADSSLHTPLASGLPLRLRFNVELWNDRFLADALVERATWALIVYHEPLSEMYAVTRSWDLSNIEWRANLQDTAAAIERWYLSPQSGPAAGSGTYYYEAQLEVEILSLGDLEELGHWLKGEREQEGGDVESALGRGLKRLFIRLIGLSVRRFEARTEQFRP